jgi:hypothetical protein
MKPIRRVIPPCPKCPFQLGQLLAILSPCSACRLNGYQTYEILSGILRRKKPGP